MKAKINMDMGGAPQYSPVNTQVAPIPTAGPNMNNIMSGMMQTSNPSVKAQNPEQAGGSGDINWNHVLASYTLQNLVQGAVSRFSPNSQQNTMLNWNKQQFSPTNFLPYTQNNSQQAKFGVPSQGMSKGGTVKMEEGGFSSSSDMADSMRKWILGDEEQSSQPIPQPVQQPQQQQQSPEYNDALQFMMFSQMFGENAADAEKGPEDDGQGYMFAKGGTTQYDAQGGPVTDGELYEILGDEASDEHIEYLKKGGWIQSANASIKRRGTKGVCTGSKFGSSSCPAGSRRYALAKTFKHMAHSRKHKKEDGGPVDPIKQAVSTTGHTIPTPQLPFRANGQVVQPSYEFIPGGANQADSTQYAQGFSNALGRMNAGKLHPFDEAAYYWSQMNGQAANARYPGVDVPGKSNMFNSGVREAYINMPPGSFQMKKDGGTYQNGGEYDISPENIIGLIGQGYQFDV